MQYQASTWTSDQQIQHLHKSSHSFHGSVILNFQASLCCQFTTIWTELQPFQESIWAMVAHCAPPTHYRVCSIIILWYVGSCLKYSQVSSNNVNIKPLSDMHHKHRELRKSLLENIDYLQKAQENRKMNLVSIPNFSIIMSPYYKRVGTQRSTLWTNT